MTKALDLDYQIFGTGEEIIRESQLIVGGNLYWVQQTKTAVQSNGKTLLTMVEIGRSLYEIRLVGCRRDTCNWNHPMNRRSTDWQGSAM